MNNNSRRATKSGRNPSLERAGYDGKPNGGVNRSGNVNPKQNKTANNNSRTNQSTRVNQGTRTNQGTRINQNTRANQGQRVNPNQRPNQPKRAARPQNQGGAAKSAQKVRRSPEEIAALKAERERLARLERKRKLAERNRIKTERAVRRRLAFIEFKKACKIFAVRAAVTVGCAAVFFGLFTALFFMGLLSQDSPDSGAYLCRVGIVEDVYSETETRGDKVYRDGAYYVELTAAATYLRLITTGDVWQIRFIFRDSGTDSVRFDRDSAAVEINGTTVNLSAPVRIEDGEIWVPAEFFTRYVSGVEVVADAETRTVELSRTLTPESAVSVTAYRASRADNDRKNDIPLEDVTIAYELACLNLRTAEPTEKIPEYSLGMELLELTDPVAKIIAESSGELIGD